MKNLRLWDTKLKVKNTVDLSAEGINTSIFIHSNSTWIATGFPRTLDGKMMYEVQPFVSNGVHEGVTGLDALVLTEKELNQYFEPKK